MKKTVKVTKPKSLLLIIAMITLMTMLTSVVAYAHNVEASVKAVNVLGYKYVDLSTLKVYFDKGMYNLNQGQFKIETEGGSPVTISNMSVASGTGCSGWTNPLSPGGTTVTLTTSLSYNTRYKVTVSSTAQMGNSFHLSLGNYLLHSDVQFFFKTPNSDNTTYSGTAQLTMIPTGDYVGVSNNVEVISDIPIDTTYQYFNLSDMKLQKSSDNGDKDPYTDVTMDTTLDTNSTPDAEYYTGQINDAHNCLFLPLSIGQNTTPAYNLLSYREYYKLILPQIKDVNDNNVTAPDNTVFLTGKDDTPASLGNLIQTVTGYTSNSVSLSWSDVVSKDDSGIIPNHYHVYYSTNPYFGFVKSADTVSDNGTTSTCTVNGLSSATIYYFRIVPANYYDEEGGFSPYVSQVTN